MIKGIIFDLDNTLVNFNEMKRKAVEAAAEAMVETGIGMSKEKLIEEIYKIYWREGIEDQHVFDKVLIEKFGGIDYKILASGIIAYRKTKEAVMKLFPHTLDVLTELLRMGLKMGLVSDASKLAVWMRIMSLGIFNFFDCVIGFEDTREHKPSPKPFLLALEKLKLSPDNCLMVGDWLERDILGAKRIGIRTVFAKYGASEGDISTDVDADYEIMDISELLRIVRSENEK